MPGVRRRSIIPTCSGRFASRTSLHSTRPFLLEIWNAFPTSNNLRRHRRCGSQPVLPPKRLWDAPEQGQGGGGVSLERRMNVEPEDRESPTRARRGSWFVLPRGAAGYCRGSAPAVLCLDEIVLSSYAADKGHFDPSRAHTASGTRGVAVIGNKHSKHQKY